MREHRCVERRDAVEDRRLVCAQPGEHGGGRRPFRHQDGSRPDRHRKAEAVAEPVGEEQLRGGKHDVALLDPEDRPRVELGGLDHARVDVDGALGRAGGSRRIEPETGIVAGRGGALEALRRVGHQGREGIGTFDLFSRDQDPPQQRQLPEQRQEQRQQRRGNDGDPRAAVGQHVLVVALGQQRVDRNRHHPGPDRPEERAGEVDRVVHAQQNPLLDVDAELAQHVGELRRAPVDVGVGVRAGVVDERGLVPPPCGEITPDQVVGRIVLPGDRDDRRTHAMVRTAQRPHCRTSSRNRRRAAAAPRPHYAMGPRRGMRGSAADYSGGSGCFLELTRWAWAPSDPPASMNWTAAPISRCSNGGCTTLSRLK